MRNLDSNFLSKYAFNLRWAELPKDVIPFTAADWDVQSHSSISESIQNYLSFQGFPYGPSQGLIEFRSALAEHFNSHKNAELNPSQILATNSAAAAIDHLYQYLLQPQDEILLPDPVDFLLAECAHRMNVQVVRFMQDKNGIDLHELEQKISPKTKALVICNPHNPLGYVLSKDQINDLYAFCEKHSIALISDEVWSDMVHTERGFSSAINVGKNAWVIYGFSKGFGMAGLRIGAIIGPNENSVLDLMNKQGYDRTIEGASTLSQIAATSAMQHSWEYTCQLKSLFLNNLIHAQERISNETICRCEVPEGTFVMTIHHPEPWDTELFCDFARNEFKIAVVPGLEKWFGAGAKNTFRISLATNEKTAVEGVDRLVKAIQTFGSNL